MDANGGQLAQRRTQIQLPQMIHMTSLQKTQHGGMIPDNIAKVHAAFNVLLSINGRRIQELKLHIKHLHHEAEEHSYTRPVAMTHSPRTKRDPQLPSSAPMVHGCSSSGWE